MAHPEDLTEIGNRRIHLGECGWFWVWAGVGGCVAISFISYIGFLFLPVAGVLALVAARWGGGLSRSTLGLLSGAGIPFLVVAYIQRKGPGTVCWDTGTASGCDEYLDPRPWLAIGVALIVAGGAAFWRARRFVR